MNRRTKGEKLFALLNAVILLLALLCTLYPCIYVLFASVSDPTKVFEKALLLYPQGINLGNYIAVFENSLIWSGYANTIFYAVVGTTASVLITVIAAFCLSRRDLPGKNMIIMAMVFTMYFTGGMIPNYLVVRSLGLLDTRASMILPTLMSTYNFIIVLTSFKGLPPSLEEAATIDGANEYTVLFKVLMPLLKPVISVIALYYLVAIWNNFMSALLYLSDPKKYPLQLVLREILYQGTMQQETSSQIDTATMQQETIKYAVMVVSTVPVMCVYPFIQRYFVKGIMIGAVKG